MEISPLPFSVLIMVYHKEKPANFRLALKSTMEQSLKPTEVVITRHGALPEGLNQVIEDFKAQYPEVIRITDADSRYSLGHARQVGLEACTHDYVAIMDADDIARPNRFEVQFEFLKNHPEVDVLGSWIVEFSDSPERPQAVRQVPTGHQEICRFARWRNPFNHMTVVFRKSAVLEVGSYRDIPYFEDYDLWVRMILAGKQMANIGEVLVDARAGQGMIARRGGLKYVRQELAFQWRSLKWGFISPLEFCKNLILRGSARIIPGRLRTILYGQLARS